MIEFGDDFLHDSAVEHLLVLWEERAVVLRLYVFLRPESGDDAALCEIRYSGCTDLKVPHKAPWGESYFVNSNGHDGDRHWIEMQSGDLIEVRAQGAQLVRLDEQL